MTISYGPYYTAPKSTDVDFLFDVFADTGSNVSVLPMFSVQGLGTVPDWNMGDAVLKMPYITGGIDGAREASGIPDIPALTFTVNGAINNPIPLSLLVVSGATGATGGLVLPSLNVGLTATFTYKLGDVDIPDFVIDATADTPWVLRGDIDLPYLALSGVAGARASQMIPDLTVSGIAISLVPGAGRFFMAPLVVSGSADTEYLGNGNYAIPTIAMSGVGVVGPAGTAAVSLPEMIMAGIAAFSPLGDRIGEYVLPLSAVKGTGFTPKQETIIRFEATVCRV